MVLVTQIPITLLHRRTSETCYFLNLAPGYMDILFMEIHWDVHLKNFHAFYAFSISTKSKNLYATLNFAHSLLYYSPDLLTTAWRAFRKTYLCNLLCAYRLQVILYGYLHARA